MKNLKNDAKFDQSGIAAMVAQLVKTAPVVAPVVKAAKPHTVVASSVKASVKPYNNAIKFSVKSSSGASALFAHTSAWLELSGMIYGGEYPAKYLAQLGGTAYKNHSKLGNFTESQGMAKLTAQGLKKFQDRDNGIGNQTFSFEDKEHYMLMMIHGFNDGRLVHDNVIKPLV